MTKIDSLSVRGTSGSTPENGTPLAPTGKTAVATPTQTKPGAALVALSGVTTQSAGKSFRTSAAPDVPQHPAHNHVGLTQIAGSLLRQAGRDAEKLAGVATKAADVILEASRKV
ncbi:hypothetical protein [Paraburkholderia fungorum]|uniref:Uncharacterized protein n=1 Tax=Paraburkholderia fungorum TaxID=134537 RepID=A0A3R7I5F1_9BURK|nr:hypothetical protein [Paraburkholderia fungorum]RKF31430.1 hypothetical protein BCY88_11670 [Paraburkholderia fungorum]